MKFSRQCCLAGLLRPERHADDAKNALERSQKSSFTMNADMAEVEKLLPESENKEPGFPSPQTRPIADLIREDSLTTI